MERATGTEVYDGCGSPQSTDITLNIQTTTGGNFSISLNGKSTVEHLKKLVSKKLKVSKDRICLLHRERQLREGTLADNGVLDGARVILLPSVETGLLSQRPENSVMQALESLNDTQVNDFLSGKSPLNLTMRLGDHMMLIQLQLSTLNSSSSGSSRSLRTSTPVKPSTSSLRTRSDARDTPSPQNSPQKLSNNEETCTDSHKSKDTQAPILQRQDLEILQNAFDLYRTMAEEKYTDRPDPADEKEETIDSSNCTISETSDTSIENEQSPIKSLSNLVSSPIDISASESKESVTSTPSKSNLIELLNNKTCSDVIPSTSAIVDSKGSPSSCLPTDSSLSDDSDTFTDQSSFLAESTIDEYPMENLFNSAVDKGLFENQDESMMDREISNLATTSHGRDSTSGPLPSFQSLNEAPKNKRFQCLLHKTSKFKHPIGQSKQKAFMQSVVNKHKKRMLIRQESNLAQPSTSRTEPYVSNSRKLILQPSPEPTASGTAAAPDPTPSTSSGSAPAAVDTKALIEASKNLTQKLKKLSKEVLTNKIDLRTAEETVRSKIGPGAVIESMKHHGKGIYSGTFSGTLNPALQDRYGRPKRDISTIIHILNDLLCAAPPITLTPKESKHSVSTSTSEDGKCAGCSKAVDGDATTATAAGGSGGSSTTTTTTTADRCPCGTAAGWACKHCDTAKALALDNSKTKYKLEKLRLVMQQKKQRREARKLQALPYSAAAPPAAPPPPGPPPPPRHEHIDTLA